MKKDLEDFENANNIKLPSELKVVYSVFDLSLLTLHYLDEKEDFFFRLTKWIEFSLDGNAIYIDDFFKAKELSDKWISFIETWEEGSLSLPIASVSNPPNSLINIGIKESNYGEIWLVEPERKIKISDSLSDFILGLKQVLRDPLPISMDKLYYDFDSDFWKVH